MDLENDQNDGSLVLPEGLGEEQSSSSGDSAPKRWQGSWYVLRVAFGKEDVVKKRISQGCALCPEMRKSIQDILIPVEKVSELRNGKQCVVERKIWPSYLFIRMEMSDESWQFLRKIDGVLAFVGGAKPSLLDESEVKELLKDLDDKKGSVRRGGQFVVGDHVSVIDGALSGLIGEVIAIFEDKFCHRIENKKLISIL